MKKHENQSKKEEYISQEDRIIEKVEQLNLCESEMGRNTMKESELYSGVNKEELRKILIKDSEEHDSKINLGATIYELMGENTLKQDSIKPAYKEALDLFVKQKQSINQQNVTLRPWQEHLMNKIENPSYREVIWVKGTNGCEGKSWFQDYVESKYGWTRVVSGMDIKAKNSNICHALGKRPLTTTDIFLFNVGKANTSDEVNYEVLEKIKDGKLLASKYDSKELRIRTPNVVVVFSNGNPKVGELALDRWCIFSIIDNKLVDITMKTLTPRAY